MNGTAHDLAARRNLLFNVGKLCRILLNQYGTHRYVQVSHRGADLRGKIVNGSWISKRALLVTMTFFPTETVVSNVSIWLTGIKL